MTRTLLLSLFIVPLALGCHRVHTTSSAATTASGRDTDNLTGAQRVQHAVPVLNRTVTQNDLQQLQTFMEQAKAEKGSYPTSLADLPSLQRDAPKLYKAIQDGELVLVGGSSGVLAYEKAAMEDRGSVVTTSGIQVMTAGELQQKLKSGR
jgi:hypothetical protein